MQWLWTIKSHLGYFECPKVTLLYNHLERKPWRDRHWQQSTSWKRSRRGRSMSVVSVPRSVSSQSDARAIASESIAWSVSPTLGRFAISVLSNVHNPFWSRKFLASALSSSVLSQQHNVHCQSAQWRNSTTISVSAHLYLLTKFTGKGWS